MPQPFSVRSQDKPGTDLGMWDKDGNITIPGILTAANVVNTGGGGGGSSVASVTALDSTVTVAGTTNVTVGVNAIPESKVTNLVTDLGLKSPLASPTFTGTVTLPKVVVGGAIVETPDVLTFVGAGTTLVDASLGNTFRLALTGNTTMGVPSNPSDGQKILFELHQDATGTRTITWPATTGGYSFGAVTAPTLSTGANKYDLVGFYYNSAASLWYYLGSTLGF